MARSVYFDVLKAVAIISVVLYHLGICEFGYLGVDVFLVIAGYFTTKSVDKQIVGGGRYLPFVANRFFRLLPLLMLAGIVCLLFGLFFMLPDDYENVAQSVVATNLFANNILQSITTKNYWATVNEYKPLMHTWYVGLLMQFYITIPLVLFVIGKYKKDNRFKWSIYALIAIGIVSLLMYLLSDSSVERFYYLPYRLFEFSLGGVVALICTKKQLIPEKIGEIVFVFFYIIILGILFSQVGVISASAKLLTVVISTAGLLYLMPKVKFAQNFIFSNKIAAAIGASSFSIFVWHQVVFALTRYSFTANLTKPIVAVAIFLIIAILSYLSYRYIEQLAKNKFTWTLVLVATFIATTYSLYIYKIAGVVRDVPELEVVKGNALRGQWAEYCDRGYAYDKDFADNSKPHWLVIGNSFGRDWVNIVRESVISDKVEVSYITSDSYRAKASRFEQADVVFLSTLGVDEALIENIQKCCSPQTKFYIIGEKNFGESNGQIYRKRHAEDYLQQYIEMGKGFAEKNERLKNAYPDIYIDLIEKVQREDGKVRVFSDNGRYISQDCYHLTQAGAQYFAGIIDWTYFFN